MKGMSLKTKTIYKLVIVFGLVLSLGACSLEKPESPTWDTNLVVPLISHNYDMLEIVDRMDEDNLGYDSLGNISVSIEQEMDTVAIDAGLTVDGISTNYSEQLGSIQISSPAPVEQQIRLVDYVSLGAGGEIPNTTITANESLPVITEFNSVTIESGSLVITATNNFGLDLDSATVGILDLGSYELVGVVSFPNGIATGESDDGSIDLAGKTLYNTLSYISYLYIAGDTLLTLADKEVSIEAGFSPTVTAVSYTHLTLPTN